MAISELVMPKMGESIMEATILRWHKKVGDFVKMDETILDIATDKVDSEVPCTAEGIITEILFKENDVVPIGAVLCKINSEINVATAATVETPVFAAAPQPEPVVEPTPVVQEPVVATTTFVQPIYEPTPQPVTPAQEFIPFVPAASSMPTVANNNRFFSPLVLNIANSEGLSLSELERIPGTGADGRVSKKDVLQYIADKRAGRVPIYTTPQPQQFYTAPTQPVFPVSVPHEVVAPIENNLSVPIVENEVQQKQDIGFYPVATPSFEPFEPSTPAPIQPVVEQTTMNEVVEEIQAASQSVAEVTENNIVEEKPLEAPVSTVAETPKVEEPVKPVEPEFDQSKYKNAEIIQMDRMRKLIAKHMVDSKATSPHVTSFTEADVTNMVTWRNNIKAEFEKREGMKITFTPMFIECILKVMKHYPMINSSVVGDKIIVKKDFNIGMATALPSGNLIVPVIKNAAEHNFINLTRAVNNLADNARQGKLSPDDVMDGTFTFTNVGTFGSLMGTPIINQPQVAILAVGEIKKRPVVVETDKGDFIGIRHMMYLSLSYDHRIIDGSIGASFLSDVAKEMEAWDVNRQLKYVVKEWYVE